MDANVKTKLEKYLGKSAIETLEARLSEASRQAKNLLIESKGQPTTAVEFVAKQLSFSALDASRRINNEAGRLEALATDFARLAEENILAGNSDLSELADEFSRRVDNPTLADLTKEYTSVKPADIINRPKLNIFRVTDYLGGVH